MREHINLLGTGANTAYFAGGGVMLILHKNQKNNREITVSMDYAYLHSKDGKEMKVKEAGMPVVIMHDSESKAVIAFVVPKKGECDYATRRVHKDITEILGYRKFIFKGDHEPALQTLKANVVIFNHGGGSSNRTSNNRAITYRGITKQRRCRECCGEITGTIQINEE